MTLRTRKARATFASVVAITIALLTVLAYALGPFIAEYGWGWGLQAIGWLVAGAVAVAVIVGAVFVLAYLVDVWVKRGE